MPHVSRRTFLRMTGAALAASAFPPSIERALAIPARSRRGSIMDVEHVVILMQENRSFDHYFGTMPGVRGFGDRITLPLPGGRSVWEQQNAGGTTVLPYRLDAEIGNAQRVLGTPHFWPDSQSAWNAGATGHWPEFKQPWSMGYYAEAELPFQFALARAFTVCDAYHGDLIAPDVTALAACERERAAERTIGALRRPRTGTGTDSGGRGLRLLRNGQRAGAFLFTVGVHQRTEDPLHDRDLRVHGHETVERACPVLLRAVVSVRKHGEVPCGGEHRIGRELEVDGKFGEGFAVDDHVSPLAIRLSETGARIAQE